MTDEGRQAIVFPGQGSQKQGMGKDFYDGSAVAREVYGEASDALGLDVAALCFEEDDRLGLTEYAQPAILTTELAMYRAIDQRWGLMPACFGGHSLGEYAALTVAGVIPFADAVRVVRTRGKLMQWAAPVGLGGMAAVIADHLDRDELEAILGELPLDIANHNSRRQVVISGETRGLSEAERRLGDAWGPERPFRFVSLPVSAPFHSRFMRAIEAPFRKALEDIAGRIDPGAADGVTSNVTGGFHDRDRTSVINRLVAQLAGTVRWIENMEVLAARAESILEIGPARPLRDFFRTIDIDCTAITTLSAAERVFSGGRDNG